MLKKKKPETDPLQQLGYEASDVSVTALAGAVVGIFLFVGFASAVSFGFYFAFVPKEASLESQNLQPTNAAHRMPPEEYRVQGYPVPDMIHFREQENKDLASYAWKDKAKGVVKIDIERAIDLAAERGIPEPTKKAMSDTTPANTQPTANTAPTNGTPATPTGSPAPGNQPGTNGSTQNVPEQATPNTASPNAGGTGNIGAVGGTTTRAPGNARKE